MQLFSALILYNIIPTKSTVDSDFGIYTVILKVCSDFGICRELLSMKVSTLIRYILTFGFGCVTMLLIRNAERRNKVEN